MALLSFQTSSSSESGESGWVGKVRFKGCTGLRETGLSIEESDSSMTSLVSVRCLQQWSLSESELRIIRRERGVLILPDLAGVDGALRCLLSLNLLPIPRRPTLARESNFCLSACPCWVAMNQAFEGGLAQTFFALYWIGKWLSVVSPPDDYESTHPSSSSEEISITSFPATSLLRFGRLFAIPG